MRVEFKEGFKLVLVAENELERLFMLEWDLRANIELTNKHDQDYRVIDPAFVTWKTDQLSR